MSMKILTSVACDKCGAVGPGTSLGKSQTRALRAEAKKAGWKLGKQKDFCPSCSAEIAEAVKQATAGNL